MAKIPVFVVHGFLESGKTQFAMETLSDEYFSDGERNLVIACEEGIEEYEDEVLQKSNTTLVMLEDKSEFNEMFLAECQKKYKPTQVIVEYNCMWGLDYLREMYMPKGWFVAQVITTVDATTFDVYLKNMKSIFMEMAKDSDLIIFNRSTEDTPAATYKRNMRAVNPKAQVVFEKEDGSQLEFEEELPFDINADVIEISDADYALWFMDCMENPKKYDGKTVHFLGLVYNPKDGKLKRGVIVPGRFAMTCCIEDITFLGMMCKTGMENTPEHRSWIDLTARIKVEFAKEYKGRGPILYPIELKPAEKPEDELVYFS